MKTIYSIFIFLAAFGAKGQAHLGSTEYEIRSLYPEKNWETSYADNGKKYISANFVFGTFAYYFDPETKLSNFCIQIPFNLAKLNAQVEIYNKKYVITSDTSWTAYLENGGILYIKLVYDRDTKLSYFTYSSPK